MPLDLKKSKRLGVFGISSLAFHLWMRLMFQHTLLKIKVLQKVLKRCYRITLFGSTKNHSVNGYSLWNHLDKKVILWHREAPLF